MKIKLFSKNVLAPKRMHETDAGLDCFMPKGFIILPFQTRCLSLDVGFCLEKNTAGIFVPRSSIAKKGLIITPAFVDPSYTSTCHLIISNCSLLPRKFKKGDRVCSFAVFEVKHEKLEIVDEFEKTGRGDNGLGSTGR